MGERCLKTLLKRNNYDELEKIFWEYVDNTESSKIQVEYAADLPNNEFGDNFIDEEKKWYIDHPWNLNKMHLRHNSLLQF